MNRRDLLAAGAGLTLIGAAPAAAQGASRSDPPARRMLSASDFGAVGDGSADDTAALQAALDATFGPERAGFLVIPPGTYRVRRTLTVEWPKGRENNLTRQSGISAHGARIVSEIEGGGNVFDFRSFATVRFLLIEGLEIRGSGRDGHGLNFDCEREGAYIYNFCLRDVVSQGCGGDGCRMIGNVFEGQIFNSYFRDNKGNGTTFGHGRKGGILSAMHVYGCVFGQNGQHGAALINNCYDISFHGCYFLLNGKFGLNAENGCTLLTNCGFENNQKDASSFETGDAGIRLQVFGTLIGCTAYSIYQQTHLIRAFVTNQITMIGCTGSGGGKAKGAKLAKLQGDGNCKATIIGCNGEVDYVGGIEALEVGQNDFGVRFGSRWNSSNLPRMGDYRLWVDGKGKLRVKHGDPLSDLDGSLVGA